jgi:hypothetical protein
MIKAILAFGADVNMTNNSGETPLHRLVTDVITASEDYLDILSAFLDSRPDVTSPMCSGSSLLVVFLDRSDILSRDSRWSGGYMITGFRSLEQFLDAGADRNTKFRSKPLLDYCLERAVFGNMVPPKSLSGFFFKKLTSTL